MSRTLSFFDRAWAAAREHAKAGRRADAVALLTNLLARPGLPGPVAAKAHRLAGRSHLLAERYARARRHLRAAAKLEPGDADTQYRLGLAYENDPYGCDRRAARRFRKAAALDRTNARYWAAFARAAARCGADAAAVRAADTAAGLAPGYAPVLAVVAEALTAAGRADRAVAMIGKARFAAPGDAAVAGLWDRVRFAAAAAGQRPAGPRRATNPAVLPFVRVAGGAVGGRVVRRDVASAAVPHVGRLTVRGIGR
jgi:Flp pilus assembly protein TadD